MKDIIIENGAIFRLDNEFHSGTIAVSNGRITNEFPEDAERIDADGMYVIPGLTDIHFHGCISSCTFSRSVNQHPHFIVLVIDR